MASVFTQIVNGEIPCFKIAETERFFAFLDVNPLAKGHCLIIPKEEIDYLFDLKEEDYIGLQLFAKILAGALKKAIPCKRVGMAVLGLEVPHAHIHLIPLNQEGDLNFSNSRIKLGSEEMQQIADSIRKNL